AVQGVATFSNVIIDQAGTFTLTAKADGLRSSDSNPITVAPGAPASIALTPGSQTLNAGQCSAALTLQAYDKFNEPAVFANGTTFNLSSSQIGAVLSFYSDKSCTQQLANGALKIQAGSGTGTFYFASNIAGQATLTADNGSLNAQQDEMINP